jgi:hypothetical protein
MKRTVLALSGLIFLAGCTTSSGSGAVSALSPELRSGARVGSVVLANTPTNTSDNFKETFQTAVQNKLNACATGSSALTLTVTLDGYKSANAAIALMVPAQSEISGVARLTDASGRQVGEYRIRRTLMAGGVVGMAMAAGAEGNMSNAFGEELCKQAFEAA